MRSFPKFMYVVLSLSLSLSVFVLYRQVALYSLPRNEQHTHTHKHTHNNHLSLYHRMHPKKRRRRRKSAKRRRKPAILWTKQVIVTAHTIHNEYISYINTNNEQVHTAHRHTYIHTQLTLTRTTTEIILFSTLCLPLPLHISNCGLVSFLLDLCSVHYTYI